MSSSIFSSSSRDRFVEVRKAVGADNLLLGAFAALYAGWWLLFIGGVRGSSDGNAALTRTAGLAALAVALLWLHLGRRSLRPAFATIAVAGGVFLAVGEAYFRIDAFGIDAITHADQYVPASVDYPLCPIPTSGETHTGFAPNAHCRLKGAVFETNSLGFRDAERTLAKRPGCLRIVVVGASQLMGAGVAQEDVFTVVLQDILRRGDPTGDYEVINLSRGAYQSIDLLETLERWGLRFDPDIIVVKGHAGRSETPRSVRRQAPTAWEVAASLYQHPYTASFFFQAIRSAVYQRLVDPVLAVLRRAPTGQGGKGGQTGKTGPTELMSVEEITPESEPRYYLQDRFVQLAAGRKLFFVRTRGIEDKELFIFVGDNHPNAAAHRVYAETLLEHLKPAIEKLRHPQG